MKKYFITVMLIVAAVLENVAAEQEPQGGYRGFVDWECLINPNPGFIAGEGGESDFWTGFSTVHGYQFNPHLFVGGGMSFVWIVNDCDYASEVSKLKYMPLFADVRTDWRFGRFTPFADLRMGCNLVGHGGFSGALTVGYRFDWGRKVAVNLALGVNMRGARHTYYESILDDNGLLIGHRPDGHYMGYDVMPVIRLGFEF